MSDGDELKVQSSDGFSLYFGYDNVYAPDSSQGDMIVASWASDYGFVSDYPYGMMSSPTPRGSAQTSNYPQHSMKSQKIVGRLS